LDESTPSATTGEDGKATFDLGSAEAGVIKYKVIINDIILGEFTVEYLADEGKLTLGDNYPNPFQQRTILPITVPSAMPVEIRVYDILGQPVMIAFDEVVEPGYYEVPFSADGLSSGVYFYRMFANGEILTERMVMVK
jgi:hypothetical protein